mmetsp:Transcript_21882/g.55159  ORF Transcript_21882/g.55159 Transcript_21882/m.55159 type:complete len:177 (+) Transcript_21882:65-595(+)
MGMCTLRPLVAATFMACALLIVIRSPLAVADDHASQGVFGWLMYVPGEDGGPVGLLARVVVETNSSLLSSSPSCAEVTFSAADGAQPLLTVQRGNNPDPDLFPVIVCDASVPFDTALSVYVGESETPVLELRRSVSRAYWTAALTIKTTIKRFLNGVVRALHLLCLSCISCCLDCS